MSNIEIAHLTDVWAYINLNPLAHKLQLGSNFFPKGLR